MQMVSQVSKKIIIVIALAVFWMQILTIENTCIQNTVKKQINCFTLSWGSTKIGSMYMSYNLW